MKSIKIFIIGRSEASYRTQNLIKYLLDQQYQLYYNAFLNNFLINETGYKKFFRFLSRIIEEAFKKPLTIYNMIIADIVILPAICNNYQFELTLAHFLKKKIITDYYLSFYDTWVLDRKDFKINSRLANKMINYDLKSITKADYTLFLNMTEAKYYLKHLNLPFNKNKHLIVPLCVEESIKCNLPFFNNKSEILNVCWWGTYIPLHGLENIFEAFKILKSSYKIKCHLYLFGTEFNDDYIQYSNLINELDLSTHITMNNKFTFKNGKLGTFLENNCDLALGNFGNTQKAKNVLVNKLIDGVAMKAPILTGESLAPRDFFSDKEIFYSSNNPEDIAEKICMISKLSSKEINNRVNKAYRIYQKNFSVIAFCNNIEMVFNKLNL